MKLWNWIRFRSRKSKDKNLSKSEHNLPSKLSHTYRNIVKFSSNSELINLGQTKEKNLSTFGHHSNQNMHISVMTDSVISIEMQDFKTNSVDILQEENQNSIFDRKNMHRSTSQRQAKKVNIPCVPNLVDAATAEEVKTNIKNNNNNNNISNKSNVCEPMTNGRRPIFNYWPSVSATNLNSSNMADFAQKMSDVNGSKFLTDKNPTVYNYATLMVSNNSGHIAHSQQQQLSSANSYVVNGPVANAICSTSSLWMSTNGPMRHRNSTGSTSSHSSSGFESMKSGSQQHPHVVINGLRGDSPPSRNSIHSSSGSSSFGSIDRLDESSASTAAINLGDMVQNGIPDHDIISCWLHSLHYEEYTPLFLNAGYDLATIARMTPEDLTAIGITKPGHRKRLTTEIHRMNIIDSWPDKKPAKVTEWLSALDLTEYSNAFSSQGYDTMDKIMQMIFEDFEDVGVKKLGHLKKLLCAVKKIKDGRQSNNNNNNNQRKSTISFDSSSSSSSSSNNNIVDQATEVLVINHHTANGHKSQSPYAMVTFQQSPKPLCQSQDLSDCQARSPIPAPCPSPLILSPSHRHQTLSPRCSNDTVFFNNDGQSCGPLWRPNGQSPNVNGYLARAPSVEGVKYPSQSHLTACSGRINTTPSVSSAMAVSSESVLLAQSALASAPKFRSCSRNGSPASAANYRRCSTNDGGCPSTFSSSSCENLMQKSLSNYSAGGGAVACGPWGVAATSEASRRKSVQQIYSPGKSNYTRLEMVKLVWNKSQNSISADPEHNSQVPCSSSASVFHRNGGPVLSKAGDSTTELSPAPSIDDFPPPPDPLMCEEHIKQLRSISYSCNESYGTLQQNRWPSNQQKTRSLSLTTAPPCIKSPLLNAQRQTTVINGNGAESCLSINSNSSSEALPFANENIGTIRQKVAENGFPGAETHTGDYGVGHLTLKQKTFSRPPIGKVFEESGGRNCSTENRTCTKTSKPGNVLNDIGHMLQDLTDELDALLCDPSAKSQKVN